MDEAEKKCDRSDGGQWLLALTAAALAIPPLLPFPDVFLPTPLLLPHGGINPGWRRDHAGRSRRRIK